jgi:hypothetical protein
MIHPDWESEREDLRASLLRALRRAKAAEARAVELEKKST